MTVTSLAKISLHHSQSRVRPSAVKFSIKLRMSFGAELIGFSLALGTNDVVTGKRSIVVVSPRNLYASLRRELHTSTWIDVQTTYPLR